VQVPPLRVRRSDVRAMQAFFLRGIAKQRDLPNLRLSDEAGELDGWLGGWCG